MAFDERKWAAAKKKTINRLNLYRDLKQSQNPGLHTAVDAFYEQLRYEGWEINAGRQPAANTQAVGDLIGHLKSAGALSVRADWWIRNQDLEKNLEWNAWQADLWAAAGRHAINVGLWSKTTGMPAELRAQENDGNTLEWSPAMLAFDDLTPAFDRGTPSPTLNYMWGESSHTFVGHARGTVHADVLRGIDATSVLNTIEVPALLNMMEEGLVDGVTFHVRRRDAGKVLREVGTYTISSRESWDAVLPLDRTPSYQEEQNQEYKTQQVSRAILKNRDGALQSLADFRQVLDNARGSDSIVVMTHEDTEFPDEMKASSKDLESWKYRSRSAPGPAQTLHRKLRDAALKQDARGSSSSSSSKSSSKSKSKSTSRSKAATTSRTTRGSTQTARTTSTHGSGDYLVPVNTQNSSERVYMSNSHAQLPPAGQMYIAQPQFQTPEYEPENPLERSMSNLTIAPDDTGYTPQPNYYTGNENYSGHQDPYGNQETQHSSYYPENPTTDSSVVTSNWRLQDPVGQYSTAPNPTGGYYDSYNSYNSYNSYDRQDSTSSASSGFGTELTRTHANDTNQLLDLSPADRYQAPSPPPPAAKASKQSRRTR